MAKGKVVDEFGNIHFLSRKIGQGGQGAVFLTDDPTLAVKCVLDDNENPIIDAQSIENYNKASKRIKMYPIPDDISIAKSDALLKSCVGYVMALLEEMRPLTSLFPSPKDLSPKNIPDSILPEIDDNSEDAKKIARNFIFYFKTGGVRKRLMALANAASILSRLHAKGLIYGDVSPNNIFISDKPDDYKICFIDSDNIRFESASKTGSSVYTPKYGAPEVVNGIDSMRMYGDCYAFAVTAFYVLTQMHPFEGDLFYSEDWADVNADGGDVGQKAYSGMLPWIFDENDDSNFLSKTSGFDTISLTPGLMALFQKTFGIGRSNGYERPPIFHWLKPLLKAADSTLMCQHCHGTFYKGDFMGNSQKCPFCDTPMPSFFGFESEVYKNQIHKWSFFRECPKGEFEVDLPYRLFSDIGSRSFDECVLKITKNRDGLYIQNMKSESFEIKVAFDGDDYGRFFPLTYEKFEITKSCLNKEWFIYANSGTSRLVRCSYNKGGYDEF